MKNAATYLFVLGSLLLACGGEEGGSVGSASAAGTGTTGAAGARGLIVPTAAAGTSGSAATGQVGVGVAGQPGAAGTPAAPGGAAGRGGWRPPTAGTPGSLPAAGAPPLPAAGTTAPVPPAAGSGAGTPPPAATGDRATVEGTCARWKGDRADVSEGMWTGSVDGCNAGDMAPAARANALRVLNLYRWLADMPAVTSDPTMDKQAQSCALLQRANNSLSHMPPTSWTCYMDEGAKAAGRCNISSGPAVSSVDGYMVDPGNDTTIGHRRWILSNSFGPTGIGGTDRHSCLMTFGNMKVGKPWMAWPSPGIIPLQALSQGFGQWVSKVDSTGWTVQSDKINLASAQVTVMSDGVAMPVTVTQLLGGYGSRYAIRFNPMGWSTTAGKTYSISVTGGSEPIQYDVQIADCK